jgi:hypothetical protein
MAYDDLRRTRGLETDVPSFSEYHAFPARRIMEVLITRLLDISHSQDRFSRFKHSDGV